MTQKKQTIIRHSILRDKIYYRAQKNYKDGIRDYVTQACKELSSETGYSWRTLWDIYYKQGDSE